MVPLHLQAFILFVLCASILVPSCAYTHNTTQPNSDLFLGRRSLLEKNKDGDGAPPVKKPSTTFTALGTSLSSTKTQNKTKVNKPTTSAANSTKLIKPNSPKNNTNSIDKSSNTTKTTKDSLSQQKPTPKISLKKLNSTSKPSNSTKPTSKTTNPSKPTSKTTSSTKPTSKTTNSTKPTSKISSSTKPISLLNQKSTDPKKGHKITTVKAEKKPNWSYLDDDEDDLVSEFRDMPSKFQETLLPDLEVLSTTSKAYLNRANKRMTNGFKPIVGHKYAATVASVVSFVFILIPFLLVSLIFNQIKAYFSLQKLIIFVQIYLAIYFSILCLSSLATGLEPLKFFYATSRSTYVWIQLLQTLAYVLYLLVLLMYLVLVFSTETGVGSKALGLGQTFVGLAVGLHYYVTVFHRAVLRQPPKTSWRVHAIYATCFLFICLLGRAERRKKAYVVDGAEEPKMS